MVLPSASVVLGILWTTPPVTTFRLLSPFASVFPSIFNAVSPPPMATVLVVDSPLLI